MHRRTYPNAFVFHQAQQTQAGAAQVIGRISRYAIIAFSSRLREEAEQGRFSGFKTTAAAADAVQLLVAWMKRYCQDTDDGCGWSIDLTDLEPPSVVDLVSLAMSLGVNLNLLSVSQAINEYYNSHWHDMAELRDIVTAQACQPQLVALKAAPKDYPERR